MHSLTKQAYQQIQGLLLPYTCVLCQSSTEQTIDICQACANTLKTTVNVCRQCARHLPGESDSQICGTCQKHPPAFDRTIALGFYEGCLRRLITQLKFYDKLHLSHLLGNLLLEYLDPLVKPEDDNTSVIPDLIRNPGNTKPQLIIPVPLHKKRLQSRGFNQALEIAKPIARALQIPIDTKSCTRIRNTQAQTEVKAKHRKKNVRNAFAVAKGFSAKHVAIVDDVVTTGHTVNELSRILKKQGVKTIEIWCLAKTA